MRFPDFDQESESGSELLGAERASDEFEFPTSHLQAEAEEMESAAELLGVVNEEELDQFLGGLLSRAAGAASSFLRSPAGQQIGGLLKSAAKQALPKIGSAIGARFGGSSGAQLGGKLAEDAGRLLGLELEGLSNEDSEFEVARQFVRFASEAARRAVRPGATALDARKAYQDAAREHAPGLAAPARYMTAGSPSLTGFPTTGRWIRHGQSVVLM